MDAASSYDTITRKRDGDMKSQEVPFRHFNNYVKKALIREALNHVKRHFPQLSGAAILDLASGRGGDIGKWLYMKSSPANIVGISASAEAMRATYYECYDISEQSIREAQRRYAILAPNSFSGFCASFHVADCFSENFLKYSLPQSPYFGKFHVVSIQFAFHYACRSEEAIQLLFECISNALVSGGVVMITTVSQPELSQRVQNNKLSNSLFRINFDNNLRQLLASHDSKDHFLLPIGTRYLFELDGFVNCEEYVVPSAVVEKAARRVGLSRLAAHSRSFRDFLNDYRQSWKENKGNKLSRDELELVTLYCSLFFVKD